MPRGHHDAAGRKNCAAIVLKQLCASSVSPIARPRLAARARVGERLRRVALPVCSAAGETKFKRQNDVARA
jgi:hypothetical protein